MFHFLRKSIQKAGLDIHRYRPTPEPLQILTTYDIKTVIDAGANIGQFAQEIRRTLPDATIYSFEPLPDCYERLTKAMSGDTHFHSYQVALGEKEGEVAMHRSSYSPSSSVLPMAELHKELFPHSKGSSLETVPVKRLDDVLAATPLSPNILLKIDVQGYEDKVLAGAPQTLAKAHAVLLEASFVSLYENQPLFADIYRLMQNAGLLYRGALQQKRDPVSGAVLFEDALFVRPS